MAVQLSTTSPYRHIIGDLSVRFFTLTTVNDADTLTVPGGDILIVNIMPNTAAGNANDPCATWAGNVVTFHSNGAWGGVVQVFTRVG